jgi:putative copper resistance protein D
VVAVAGAVLLAVAVAVGLLGATGQLAATVPGLFDPGALVRYGLPALRVGHDWAAALSVGSLVLTAWCVAPDSAGETDQVAGVRAHLLQLTRTAVAAWLLAGIAVLVLTAGEVSGLAPGAPGFGAVLASFVTDVDLGRALAASLVLVALVACLVLTATRITAVAAAAVVSLAALLPLALGGHAAAADDHMNAVDSLALHLVGVSVWVGGLAALVLAARPLGRQLPTVVGRYSVLAGWCFALVAASGVVNAALRLGSWSTLGTGYGLLVVGKTVALLGLGIAGYVHRRSTLPRLADGSRAFARLAVVEVALMGATMGLAVALSRSAPPVSSQDVDRVSVLLGQPAPPPLTLGRYLTVVYPEVVWVAVVLLAAGLYLGGVLRLRRRGDRWPAYRLVSWLAGCALLAFLTSGGPAVYGRIHFSTHMIQHMSLMVLVPLLGVFGAPVTLALRALAARRDGSFGPREMLLRLVHAPVLRFLGHPLTATVIFTGSLPVFYYSRLFELAMFTHTGHVLMTAHFLLSGYLFVWALVGVDPGPQRPPHAFRLVLLFMTLAFHAFFGISLMSTGSVLAPDWWFALGQTDDAALLADQQTGGAIAWATGDVPALLLAVALIASWVRSDATETRRLDRQADRDGDAELRAYNEQLAAMHRRDVRE